MPKLVFSDNLVLVVYKSLNTIEGKATNLGRTFLTLFAIYRYFTGTIDKLKVYQSQSLADLPPFTNKVLSHHYLMNFVNYLHFIMT